MAIVSLWNNPHLPDEAANVRFINKTEGGHFIEHTECGEAFELNFRKNMWDCPHCKGDLILPREEWS